MDGVLVNDTDGDEDALSAILVDDVAHGTLTLNADGSFSYTHDGSANLTDSFTYKVNDGTVDGNTVTVEFTIQPTGQTITGTTGNDVLNGGVGNDTIYGISGKDTIYGGSGNDWVQGGVQADVMDGGDGIDTVDFSYVGTSITIDMVNGTMVGSGMAFTNFENAVSGIYNDVILGDDNDNTFYGRAGNDTLHGAGGNDMLYGEAGSDTFVFDNAMGHDVVADYTDGEDTIRLVDVAGAGSLAELMSNASQAGDNVVFNFSAGNSITVHNTTIAQFTATDFDLGHDTITGTTGNDVLDGGFGNDTIYGISGKDTIYGGSGDDWVQSGPKPLTSFRFFCCTLHYTGSYPVNIAIFFAKWIRSWCFFFSYFQDLFSVKSIAINLVSSSFYWNRFARLWSTHLFCFLLVACLLSQYLGTSLSFDASGRIAVAAGALAVAVGGAVLWTRKPEALYQSLNNIRKNGQGRS